MVELLPSLCKALGSIPSIEEVEMLCVGPLCSVGTVVSRNGGGPGGKAQVCWPSSHVTNSL